MVIDGDAQFLFAAEVLFGRLHADVSKKELDLLQFASRNVAQTGTCASQIMRSKVAESSFRDKPFDNAPDHLSETPSLQTVPVLLAHRYPLRA